MDINLSKPLQTFYNPNAVIPTLLIETGVTLGRSAVAYKRGGRIEASERFVEQGTSAVVWLWGVQFLKKIGEKIGKNIPPKDKNINAFKSANVLISTFIATFFIGFILPKINHKITNKLLKKQNQNIEKATLRPLTLEEYKNKTKGKNLSFTSSFVNSLANLIENNATARLLITDTGVIAGRYKNARNKYEKIENLFRDISSIYFYLFSTKHFVTLFNKLTKSVDIDPRALEVLKEKLKDTIGRGISKKDLIEKKNSLIDNELLKDNKNVSKFFDLMINKTKQDNITLENVDKIIKSTNNKNFLFYILSTGISIFALAYLIPKIQYFITEKLTHKNKFPGTEKY